MDLKFLSWGGSCLGIDIGTSALKVVEVSPSGDKLLSYFIAEIPPITWQNPAPYSEIANLLKISLERHNIGARRAVITVSGPDLFLSSFQVPNLAGNELVGALQWTVKKFLPYPLEESLIDYYRLNGGQAASKNEVLVAAARKNLVDKLSDLAEEAGIDLIGITIQPLSLLSLFKPGQLKETSDCAVIDIGQAQTLIVIVHNGQVRFSRSVSFAGRSFAEAIAASYQTESGRVTLNLIEAEKILGQYDLISGGTELAKGSIAVSQIYNFLRPELEKLQDEIGRSFDYCESQLHLKRPARAYLTGGGSRLKNLDHWLGQGLGLPLARLDPLASFNLSDRIAGGRLDEATSARLGGALGAARDRARKIDLLAPKAVIKNYLEPVLKALANFQLRPGLFWAAAIFLLFFLLLEGNILARRLLIAYDQNRLKELVPLLIRQAKLEELKKTVSLQEKAISQTIGEALSIPPILDQLARIVPDNLMLSELSIGQVGGQLARVINLKGLIFASGVTEGTTIGNFMVTLEKKLNLDQVSLVSLKKGQFGPEDVFLFELTATVAARKQEGDNQ